MSLGHHLWLLLGVVSSGWSLSLCCMDGGSWNFGTVWWMLVYGIRMSWTLALFEILEHPGMGVCCYFLSPLWTVSKILMSSHGPVESEHLPGMARVWRCHLCTLTIFRDIDSNAISSKYSIYIYSPLLVTMASPVLSPHPVDICVTQFQSVLFVYRKSTSPSDYLLEYWSVLLEMSQRPICLWILRVPPPWVPCWTNSPCPNGCKNGCWRH